MSPLVPICGCHLRRCHHDPGLLLRHGCDSFVSLQLRPLRRYYERVANCKFCFVPKGVGYTNGRLLEAFFAGCIPVILSAWCSASTPSRALGEQVERLFVLLCPLPLKELHREI
eukprot:1151168-Amphidinium_carterae.1